MIPPRFAWRLISPQVILDPNNWMININLHKGPSSEERLCCSLRSWVSWKWLSLMVSECVVCVCQGVHAVMCDRCPLYVCWIHGKYEERRKAGRKRSSKEKVMGRGKKHFQQNLEVILSPWDRLALDLVWKWQAAITGFHQENHLRLFCNSHGVY